MYVYEIFIFPFFFKLEHLHGLTLTGLEIELKVILCWYILLTDGGISAYCYSFLVHVKRLSEMLSQMFGKVKQQNLGPD